MKLQQLEPGNEDTLPAVGTLKKEQHYYEPDHLIAVVAAWHAKRPLLVLGEPGIGKTQLARAVAHKLGWGFLPFVIRPGFGYQDLLWEFDAVARLAEAQLMSVDTTSKEDAKAALKKENFIIPGPLWWAYRPETANTQALKTDASSPVLGGKNGESVVVLLDEIDKADADLPNGLLDVLANGDLQLPVDATVEKPREVLTIITSNGDRPLPPAFVRRCLVLNMNLPDEKDNQLSGYLKKICKTRGWDTSSDKSHDDIDVTNDCIDLFIKARQDTPAAERKPSIAELLDLMKIIKGMGGSAADQLAHARELKDLVLYKTL